MSDPLKDIMRKVGDDQLKENERDRWDKKKDEADSLANDEEDLTPSELRHDRYRRKQEFASRLGPTSERLPIMSAEEIERKQKDRPKRREIKFEGPIEKLIEKYQDPKEVFNHLSIGQLMKYNLDEETGRIYEGEKLIFDGQELVKE